MRIAFVSLMAGSPWAASEVLWGEAAQRALEAGHEVLVSTYRWSIRPRSIEDLERGGAHSDLRPLHRWYRRSSLFTRLKRTFQPLKSFKPDVICVSQGGTYDIARSGSAAVLRSTLRRLNTPYMILCHCEQPAPPRRNLHAARQVFRHAAIVGMVADKVRKVSEAHLGMPITNARIFHNPVNLKRIERLPWPASGALRLAFVGRLEPVKNLGALIEALATGPWRTRDWSLSVYGAGPDRQNLEQQVQQAALQDRIVFKGYVQDIDGVWAEHHALVMPSRFEGVPLAMIEAMLCGRPVVATDIGGIADWLQEGRNGFLIAKPTPEHIGDALERMWNQREQLEQVGRRAHEMTLATRDPDPAGTLLQWAESTAAAQQPSAKSPEARVQLIAPVATGPRRPKVSVMIPTYEPQAFLVETIKSVLAQDLGAEQMQIAVVDDGSKGNHARSLLEGMVPAGRIEFYEHEQNLGLGGNWNRAVALARGEFIHILHQDDAVRPGFYAQLLAGMQQSSRVGMSFCRHLFVDDCDRIERISHRERWRPGVLNGWLERIGTAQRIQCPAALVRREAYETLGGFRADLRYALDWEMWVRIAAHYEVWYEPEVLAHYRRHAGTESARLEAAGHTTADMLMAIEMLSEHFPETRRAAVKQRAYRRVVRSHLKRALKLMDSGSPQLAIKQIDSARIASDRVADGLSKRWMQSRLLRAEARAVDDFAYTGAQRAGTTQSHVVR